MDELVAHCLREIAFDGDLGCDIPRLRTFVSSFFQQRNQVQTVDAFYFAFLWTVLVAQPPVRVGTVPPDARGAEVWVAPQPKKKKDKDADVEAEEEVKLEVVDKSRSLSELEEEFGEGLRVAVDTETIFVALTGSHLRPTRLTSTVYTALQLITRGRADGLSVVDLGKKTGYDQKACWYLVRQLVDLGLVVKLRRAGVGANFCIHRHFFERDAQWQGIQAESLASTTFAFDSTLPPAGNALNPTPGPGDDDDEDADFKPDAEAIAPPTDVTFEPIDARHLSSLALVKARIVTLLRSAPDNVYPAQNLIVTIGFTNPTKTERRFFQTRMRELVDQGVIERCAVPHPNPRRSKYRVQSIRLLDADAGPVGDADDAGVDEQEEEGETGKFKATVTLHKQILDLLENAGGAGMTLNDIVAALGNFDRRTLELILSRSDRSVPPPHLADLRVAQMLETHGKERRYRFYTLAHYAAIVSREGLDDSTGPYANAATVLEGAGGFANFRREEFYEDERELRAYVDEFTGEDAKGRAKQKGKGKAREDGDAPKKRGRKRKREDTVAVEGGEGADGAVADGGNGEEGEAPPAKKRRGRQPKAKPDPAAPPKKRGRPPKNPPPADPTNAEAGPSSVPAERSVAEVEPPSAAGPSAAPSTQGEPSNAAPEMVVPPISVLAEGSSAVAETPSAATPKKRGRPRKHPLPEPTLDEHGNPVEPPPKKRGRPPKNPPPEPELDAEGNPIPKKRGRPRKSVLPTDGVDGAEGSSTPRRSGRAPKPVVRADAAEEPGDEEEDQLVEDDTPEAARPPVRNAEGDAGRAVDEGMDTEAPTVSTADPASTSIVQPPVVTAPERAATSTFLQGADSDGQTQSDIPRSDMTFSQTSDPIPPAAIPVHFMQPEPQTDEAQGPTTEHPSTLEGATEGPPSAPVPDVPANARASDNEIPIDPALLEETGISGPSNAPPPPAIPGVGTPELSPRDQRVEDKKPLGRPRGNVSLMRRENEFMKLLTDFKGILNPGSKEFTDAHLELLNNLAASNEPTSGLPGVRVDKRTSHTTFDSLEQKGKVKQLKTIVTSSLGHSRQIRVVYLPDVEQPRVQSFLQQVSHAGGGSTMGPRAPKWQEVTSTPAPVQAPAQAPEPSTPRARSPLATRNSIPQAAPAKSLPVDLLQVDKGDVEANNARSNKLFALDDDTLRDVFLTEKNTLAQLFGWLPGKAARAREVYMAGLEEITKAAPRSRHVISPELRIISSSFYFNDMKLERWLKIISTLSHNEQLVKLMATDEGRSMLLSEVPDSIDADIQIGKARSRARFLDLFEVLCDLKIVTPLKPSTAEDAPIKVPRTGPPSDHPTAFEVWSDDWRASTSRQAAPTYWKFNEQGPIYLWVLSQDFPPFWKDMSVRTVGDAVAYWDQLERASIVQSTADSVFLPDTSSATGVQVTSVHLTRTLRRLSSWRAAYELSWHQKHYMRHYVNVKTGDTPVEDAQNGAESIARIARLTSAPVPVIREYFEKAHKKALRDMQRVQAKAKAPPAPADDNLKVRREHMANVQVQKESDWAQLVARIHPDAPLKGSHAAHVSRVHTRYMHAGAADEGHWENEIRRALQRADMANAAVLAPTGHSRVVIGGDIEGLPNIPQTGPSVRELIEAQGPAIETMPKSKKSKRAKRQQEEAAAAAGDQIAGTQETPQSSRRRHRFLWNKDYDELVEDAMVVVRTRCAKMTRVELAALDQVFPAVPRNSVRQRYTSLRAEPGKEAYLKRLEDAWLKVWIKHRNGHDDFPDPDPESATNFDLVKHVEFLRKHVDKKPLRTNEKSDVKLPLDVLELESIYDIYDSSLASGWDFVWTTVTEEGKEKGLLQTAFYTEHDFPPSQAEDINEDVRVVESGMKMVYGTPTDRYNMEQASSLLNDVPDTDVLSIAKNNLTNLGVLSKLVYDPKKPRPGRSHKISEANSNAIGGVISRDAFQDAATIDALYKEPGLDWREWALDASDGDLAMLVQATSGGTAQYRVDTSNAQQARLKLDWNSKKAVDSDFETSILVKFCSKPLGPQSERPSPPAQSVSFGGQSIPMDTDENTLHGQTADAGPACCRIFSDGVIDCAECLRVELEEAMFSLSDEQRKRHNDVLDVLDEAGPAGLTKPEVVMKLHMTFAEVLAALELLLETSIPLAFSVGYSSQVLVAARHIRRWTVTISREPLTRIFPRRWLDIGGRRIPDVYEACQRAVMSTVLLRPGISQAELRWRLKLLYDTQEVVESLSALHDAGFLCRRCPNEWMNSLIAPSKEEEQKTMWFVTDRPWYQI